MTHSISNFAKESSRQQKLRLFVSQVLSRGDACITVMAKFNRERKDRALSPVSEDASAYTKARARLPLKLINHLSDHVRKIGHNMTPNDWKWHGLNAYLVDGFVLRAPDTFANQERYPQPSSQKEGLSVRTNQAWRCANFVA